MPLDAISSEGAEQRPLSKIRVASAVRAAYAIPDKQRRVRALYQISLLSVQRIFHSTVDYWISRQLLRTDRILAKKKCRAASRENFGDHVASLPSEPLIQSVIKISEFSVVEPHQVQDGRVQIRYVHRLFHCFES